MKILHYFLGFPPYRSGGMTKFAFDLAKAQAQDGHEVSAIWPGQIIKYGDSPRIKEKAGVAGIRNFEIINPLPVSLDEGIIAFEEYTKACNSDAYRAFLSKEKPNIIHIHTLMGMHKEFIQVANELGIKTIMTSHDYFGICPKVNLYRYGSCCVNDNECRNCIQCNLSSLSLNKIQLMQSPLYRKLKDSFVVKMIRSKHRRQFFGEEHLPSMPQVDVEIVAHKYRELRSYYVGIIESINLIHFNSYLAKSIYEKYVTPKNSKVISITHEGIEPRKRKTKEHNVKVILCLAPAKPYKGWSVLKNACDQLWESGEKIELRVFSPVDNPKPYMVVREEGFKQAELADIMNEADVLVAPSVWFETFGFTVLEALSYGIPVVVSNHVGAADIIGSNGIIVEAGDADELAEAIKKSSEINVNNSEIKTWKAFLNEIYALYQE